MNHDTNVAEQSRSLFHIRWTGSKKICPSKQNPRRSSSCSEEFVRLFLHIWDTTSPYNISSQKKYYFHTFLQQVQLQRKQILSGSFYVSLHDKIRQEFFYHTILLLLRRLSHFCIKLLFSSRTRLSFSWKRSSTLKNNMFRRF